MRVQRFFLTTILVAVVHLEARIKIICLLSKYCPLPVEPVIHLALDRSEPLEPII